MIDGDGVLVCVRFSARPIQYTPPRRWLRGATAYFVSLAVGELRFNSAVVYKHWFPHSRGEVCLIKYGVSPRDY